MQHSIHHSMSIEPAPSIPYVSMYYSSTQQTTQISSAVHMSQERNASFQDGKTSNGISGCAGSSRVNPKPKPVCTSLEGKVSIDQLFVVSQTTQKIKTKTTETTNTTPSSAYPSTNPTVIGKTARRLHPATSQLLHLTTMAFRLENCNNFSLMNQCYGSQLDLVATALVPEPPASQSYKC